jgi:hypothetical protein
MGLRNRRGGTITRNGLSTILNSHFYIGLIRLRRTGETFQGAHEPLVTKQLFDRVQRILDGKTRTQGYVHDFLFRRLLLCNRCGYSLVGERQKGHVYYRCHTKSCPTVGAREETVENAVLRTLAPLEFTDEERMYLNRRVPHLREDWLRAQEDQTKGLTLRLGQVQDRLARMTDAYVDGVIEKDLFQERKTALLLERQETEEKLANLADESRSLPDQLAKFLERATNVYSSYKLGLPEEKRDLLKTVTSNRALDGKNIVLTLALPFAEIGNRAKTSNGGPYRDTPRTLDSLLHNLIKWLNDNPTAVMAVGSDSHNSTEERANKRRKFAA